MNDVLSAVATVAAGIIGGAGAVVSGFAVSYLKRKSKEFQIKNIVERSVGAVEQLAKAEDKHGEEKLKMAMEYAKIQFENAGIDVGDFELNVAIHNAVNQMNTNKEAKSC